MPCQFIQIPIELINYVKAKKLSGLQYSLWLFLYSLDPFGDRFVPIPSPKVIASELNVCPRSIQRAAQRLADLELFDFNVNTWCAKNTTTNKNSQRTKRSKCGQKDLFDPKQTKRSLRRQKAPDESIESFHSKQSGSSQTLTDKLDLSYKRDLISKQINHQEPDLEVDFWVEDDIDSSTSLPNQDLKEESESAEVEIDTSIETDLVFYRSFDKTGMSIAPRPWLIEEKLDRKFVDWLAQKWAVKYGDNLHTARSNVLRHFKKDEQNIIIAWSEYSAEYIDRYKNTQTRLASGLEISQSEQRHLIENQAALTKPIPSELSPVSELRDTTQNSTLAKKLPPEAEVNESQEISNVSVNDHTTRNKHSIDWDKLPEKEDLPENFAAYGQWQPAEIDKPADRSQVQDFLKSLCKKFSL